MCQYPACFFCILNKRTIIRDIYNSAFEYNLRYFCYTFTETRSAALTFHLNSTETSMIRAQCPLRSMAKTIIAAGRPAA